jgi:hypothetical protein
MPTLLSDYNDRRIWNALDVQAASDWINGGAVFIRNKLVTSEYWYTQDSSIVSNELASLFPSFGMQTN